MNFIDTHFGNRYPVGRVLIMLVLILLNLRLISWSSFGSLSEHFSIFLLLFVVPFFLALNRLSASVRDGLITALLVATASVSGMLLGSVADFGRWGLQTLAELCRPGIGSTVMQDLLRMLKLAPFTHLGMMLGCLAGYAVFESRNKSLHQYRAQFTLYCLHITSMFAGMFAVMWGVRLMQRSGSFDSPVYSGELLTMPLVLMWLGMLLGPWTMIEGMKRIRRRT